MSTGAVIASMGIVQRFVVLSDDRVIAEDAAQIVGERVPNAPVSCVATLPEAMAELAAEPEPVALVIIKPRRPIVGHPLVEAARQRHLPVIVLTEDEVPGDVLDGHILLGTRLPFTSQSLGALISKVVRDRLPG